MKPEMGKVHVATIILYIRLYFLFNEAVMNTYIKTFVGVIVFALIIFVGSIVIKDEKSTDTIKVGVIVPLSGQYAFIGESDRNAILMAKEELKADNIELFFEDDKYDAKTAVSAYQKLRNIDGIDVVIMMSAPSIQSVAPLTNKDGILLLGLGGTIVYEKDSVFQLMPSANLLFPMLGKIAGEKYKKIVVAHSNAALFVENTSAFMRGIPSGVDAKDITISPASDYRTEVQKIIALHPDAVTTFFPKEDAIKFLQALRVQDPEGKIRIICDFGTEIAADEYAAAIGKERLEGCVSTNLADTVTPEFKGRYKEKYGSDPQITGDFAYDAIGIIKILGKEPKEEWIKVLSSKDFEYKGGVSGDIKFNEDGTRLDLPPKVNVYKEGKFVPVE